MFYFGSIRKSTTFASVKTNKTMKKELKEIYALCNKRDAILNDIEKSICALVSKLCKEKNIAYIKFDESTTYPKVDDLITDETENITAVRCLNFEDSNISILQFNTAIEDDDKFEKSWFDRYCDVVVDTDNLIYCIENFMDNN